MEGGVYVPSLAMVPAVGDPPGVPFTDQSTVLSTELETLAWNFNVAPTRTFGSDGLSLMVGGAMTFRVRLPDDAPPGSGLATVTATDCGLVMVAWNVSAVEDPKVVGTGEPFNRTFEPLIKPFPLTVTLKVPTLTACGVSEEMDGVGFSHVTDASAKTGGVPTVARILRGVPGFAEGAT